MPAVHYNFIYSKYIIHQSLSEYDVIYRPRPHPPHCWRERCYQKYCKSRSSSRYLQGSNFAYNKLQS